MRRALPQDVAGDISLDSPLDEIGLDSLARMGMLNSLEEAFGLRFSEDSLYDMVTCGDVIEYIETHAGGGRPRQQPVAAAAVSGPPQPSATEEIPAHHYDVTQFPECVALQQRLAGMAMPGLENPFFRVKERVSKATATIAGREVVSFTSFDYLGMASDPEVRAAAKQAIDQLGNERIGKSACGGQPCDSLPIGRRTCPIPRH